MYQPTFFTIIHQYSLSNYSPVSTKITHPHLPSATHGDIARYNHHSWSGSMVPLQGKTLVAILAAFLNALSGKADGDHGEDQEVLPR